MFIGFRNLCNLLLCIPMVFALVHAIVSVKPGGEPLVPRMSAAQGCKEPNGLLVYMLRGMPRMAKKSPAANVVLCIKDVAKR